MFILNTVFLSLFYSEGVYAHYQFYTFYEFKKPCFSLHHYPFHSHSLKVAIINILVSIFPIIFLCTYNISKYMQSKFYFIKIIYAYTFKCHSAKVLYSFFKYLYLSPLYFSDFYVKLQ